MKPSVPRTYASHFCPQCLLTVVEFVNGHFDPERNLHIHDLCDPFWQAALSQGGADHAKR